MKTSIAFIFLLMSVCLVNIAEAQPINYNTNPNGEPWWFGGYDITSELEAILNSLPEFIPNEASLNTTLDPVVDNSQEIFFRQSFTGQNYACSQSSSIGYIFTYEINKIRNLSADENHPENQYPTHYTYNYLNNGDPYQAALAHDGWDIIEDCGIPNVLTWGGIAGSYTKWMTGYDNYRRALKNRVSTSRSTFYSSSIGCSETLNRIKHWLNDYGVGASDGGGLIQFGASMVNVSYGTLPASSAEQGKSVVLSWGSGGGGHAMTIVGYNDSIKYDFNNDGQFTNHLDINGDSLVDMRDWEIGALKVANSNVNWPTSVAGGFAYMPYQLLCESANNGGDYGWYTLLRVTETFTPKVTLRVMMQHPQRNRVVLSTGVSEDPNAAAPTRTKTYRAYSKKKGGSLPMQGINEDPIEIEMDITSLLDSILPGKFFFEVLELDTSTTNNGEILDFKLVDYDTQNGFPTEVNYTSSSFPIPIVKNDITKLSIPYYYIPSSIRGLVMIDREFIFNKDVKVVDGGEFMVSSIGRLIIPNNFQLVLKAGSTLSLDDCAELEILPGGKVIVEEGAILKISPNAILSAHDGQEAFSVHPSAIVPQGYVHPHEVVPPAYRIATGNHVWDAPSYVMHYDLVVEPGAKLTLQNPSLAFAGQKGITVGEGAELSIEGGLLIPNAGCSDNNVWRGIRVEGNPNEPQTAMQQGQLSMIGTTIERAKWGVQTSSGIVSVSGATFLNNEVGISFSGYRYGTSANLSEITNSTFTINDEMPQGVTPAFITLKHVAKIKIAGNTFQNVLPLAFPIPNKGYGIRAFDADVYLGQGANTFNDLFTAIDASAAITSPSLYIKNQVFERCYNGVRVSAYVSPLIRGCSFTVPNHQFESSVPTAIAIRNLNSFIVESNTIQGSGIGYGIYLEHTKSSSGVVNANSIQGLSVGVMAQGNIKRTDNTVQLKCNQFNNNGLSDILVSGNGIASIQGSRDISASNQFMESYRHIVTEYYPITYYGFAHVAEYDPTRIEGAVTVLRAERLADCSSHTGPKTYEMDGIQQASDSLVATRILLSEMQDMGETEILLTEVEEFSGYNPLDLRDALLAKSPLLSDTVMVRTSAEEVPLPNIMLAQVLMDNPQAAKSMAVLQSLSSRENPLPSYLLNAILESGGNSSPIDELKSLAAKHRAERDITASMLANRFVSDTLCKQYDSLQMLSAYHPDLIYRYISAFAAYEAGDKSQAISMLNSIGADGSLGATEMNELNDLVNLASIIAQQGEIPDSSALAEIYALSNNSEGLAKTLVQNVISFIDTVPFLAPEYVLDRATSSPESQGYNAFVEVKPYPVTSYAILHYNMGKTVSTKGTIEISNEDGVVVYQTSLTRSQFELLVKIDGWRPGLYKVFLYDSDVLLAQTSFIVEGNEHIDEDLSPIANEDNIDVVIYPNPTSGKFSIGVKGKSQMPFTYEVFTDMGVKVLSGKGVGEENLSIANNDKGVYLVVVTVNGEKFNLSVLLK